MLASGIRRAIEVTGEDVTGGIAGRFGSSRLSDLATPMSGAPTLGGAEGDWAFFHDAGLHEGMTQTDPARQVKGQGVKRHPAEDDILSKNARDLVQFGIKHILRPPTRVPIGVYRVGPIVIATLPGEFTTILGQRIAKAVLDQSPGARRTLLAGLANEYMSYFTTEEEYATQTYEASSMMYGPHAGARVRDDLAALAGTLSQAEVRSKARSYHYDAGPGGRFGVKEFDLLSHQERLVVSHNSLADVLMDPEHGIPIPDDPRFVWIDRNAAWPGDFAVPKVVMPSVAIEVYGADGWIPLAIAGAPEDDDGADFVTTVIASFLGDSRWLTIWMPPAEVKNDAALGAAEFRFAVKGNGGSFHSPGFTLASARESWGLTGIAREPEKKVRRNP
jgi:neutral ceramidase